MEDTASRSAAIDGINNTSRATKKRKIHSDYHKVIIAGCNERSAQHSICDSSTSDDVMFERGHPHWEGRWVGHLHLAFPSLESLDILIDTHSSNAQMDVRVDAIGRGDGDDGKTDDNNSSDESSSDGNSSSEDDDDMPQSRIFLPIARKLIHEWASLLEDCVSEESNTVTADETRTKTKWNGKDIPSKSPTFIVPHIPMLPIERTNTSKNKDNNPPCEEEETPISTNNILSSLHISLARPIYLPAPSVDPFLADIEKSIKTVVAASNNSRRGSTNHQTGRILHLQPRNATIFTNDEQTRSFLSIPVSNESSRWIKQTLLPPIDATMQRFGLQTYYSTEEEGCILHVSVASVKGNVIPQMLRKRKMLGDNDKNGCSSIEEGVSNIRSIALFSLPNDDDDYKQRHDATNMTTIESMPSYIPIRVHQIQCQFGKTKQMKIMI